MSHSGLFAVMVHERPPLKLDDLPGMTIAWLQDAGGFAAVGLAVWLLAQRLDRSTAPTEEKWPGWQKTLFGVLAGGAGLAYLVYGIMLVLGWLGGPSPSAQKVRDAVSTVGGFCAILAVGLPFAVRLTRLRPRRIGALALLSVQEAVRSKVLWIFSFLLLVFLFAPWFLPHQPQDQLRSYVQVIYWAMTPLLLVTAAILAAFGIPNDLRHQTIHTIVTKPVERFEIVIGRFIGYTALMTAVLLVMTTVSLLYFLVPGVVHPDAAEVTERARVPIYGNLEFQGRLPDARGVDLGREWQYRRYLPGGPTTDARAVWYWNELPTRLDRRSAVPCEFAFEVVRTTRGEDDRGVFCTLTFETWRCTEAHKLEYNRELTQVLRTGVRGEALTEVYNRLAERFGYFEIATHEVFNHKIYALDVPAGLFKNAATVDKTRMWELEQPTGRRPPWPVQVSVRCHDTRQFLGMARHDLYLLDAEGWFGINFYKGALGLWFRLCLVVGLAVACSTYLSGVITLLCTLFIYGIGLGREFVRGMAIGALEGGGPAEAFLRLVRRQNLTAPLDDSPTTQTAGVVDEVYRWLLTRILNFIPDVDRFDLSRYVSEGFDISGADVFMCSILLAGYLLPWAVLAYYLMKSRELAS